MPVVSDEKFSAAAEKLPSTPQVFEKLNRALRDPDVGVDEISEILKLDAALSARLMRLSNSAAMGGSDTASNLSEAVQRVGFREVFRVVGVAMTGQMYVAGLPIYGVGGSELWENSLAVAVANEQLATIVGVETRTAYTLGLLRPVGRLLLQKIAQAQMLAPLTGRKATGALVLAWEEANFGLTSNRAAERLISLWKLSDSFLLPLRHHFDPVGEPERSAESARLHLACWIADSLGKGLSIEKESWTLHDEILGQAQLDRATVERCAALTAEAFAELGKLMAVA
jgi:HD-like signal output (HDOD) protein